MCSEAVAVVAFHFSSSSSPPFAFFTFVFVCICTPVNAEVANDTFSIFLLKKERVVQLVFVCVGPFAG